MNPIFLHGNVRIDLREIVFISTHKAILRNGTTLYNTQTFQEQSPDFFPKLRQAYHFYHYYRALRFASLYQTITPTFAPTLTPEQVEEKYGVSISTHNAKWYIYSNKRYLHLNEAGWGDPDEGNLRYFPTREDAAAYVIANPPPGWSETAAKAAPMPSKIAREIAEAYFPPKDYHNVALVVLERNRDDLATLIDKHLERVRERMELVRDPALDALLADLTPNGDSSDE